MFWSPEDCRHPTRKAGAGREARLARQSLGLSLPDKDDDRGCLRHCPDHAADTHHTQEGEEGLLAPGTGALSGNHSRVLGRDSREARTAGEILKCKYSALLTGGISRFRTQSHPSAAAVTA